MTALDSDEMWTGTLFMTKQAGGSDVAKLEVEVRRKNGELHIHGNKWFCSHANSDVILLLE